MQLLIRISFVVACGHATNVRLDTTASTYGPWKDALDASISNLAASDDSEEAGPAGAVAAAAKQDDKGKGLLMPVKHQIPLAAMDNFVKTLSKGCGLRFKQMLAGKGGMDAFGSAAAAADAYNCAKLGGTMCFTDAHIIQSKMFGFRKRTMETVMSASGDSCLPRECVTSTDLRNVANFMQANVLAIIPGDKHRVELHVDCTKHGGSTITIGDSGTGLLAPTAMTFVAVLMLSQLAGW